ncbi:hypothetical protein HC928_00895 [bacterium]|nr:hypothetical protein [bacterium]
MANEQQSLGSVKRSIVIGLGQKSLPTLHKLRQRLYTQFGEKEVPVVATICVIPNGTALNLPELPETCTPIQTLALEEILSQAAQPDFAASVGNVMANESTAELVGRGVAIDTNIPPEIIFVGSLSDAITAEHLVKVACFAYPLVLQAAQPADFLRSIALVSLPNIRREPAMKLQAANGLKLISEQLDLQRISAAKARYDLQQVYLLEHTNRANLAISNDTVLSWMMGDWLFFYLTRGVPPVENPKDNEYYSALGYASLFVPESQMRQVLTEWFICEAYNDFLLALPSIQRKPEDPEDYVPRSSEIEAYFEGLTTTDLNRERLDVQALADELKKAEVLPRLNQAAFANTVPYLYEDLEKGLVASYDAAIQDTAEKTSALTKRLSEQDTKSRLVGDRDVLRALNDLWKEYLDKPVRDRVNYAPLQTALQFFERTRDRFDRAAEEYRNMVREKNAAVEAAHGRIINTRAKYWNAAQFLSPPTDRIPVPYILPAFTFILALCIVLYLGLILIDIFRQPILAVVLVVGTFITGIALFFAAFLRSGQFKNKLIGLYAERLKNIVDYHDARLVAGFYGRFVDQIQREYIDVLKQAIDALKDELRESEYRDQRGNPYHRIRTLPEPYPIAAALEQQLYGTPNYELETSVIRRKDIDQWYEELFPNSVQSQLLEFFEYKPDSKLNNLLSAWVRAGVHQRTLRPELEQWLAEKKLRVVKTTPIQRYLAEYAAEQQKNMAELMVKQAQSYLPINETLISQDQYMLEVIHLHIARSDKDYVKQLLKGLDRRIELNYQLNDDPLRIDTISRLRWVALGVPTVVRDLQIERIDRGDQFQLLDEFTNSQLNVYELVALGRVMQVIVEQGRELGYQQEGTRHRFSEDGKVEYTFNALGNTYHAVVNNLQDPENRIHLKAIYEQLMEKMQGALQSDPTGMALGRQIYAALDKGQVADKEERDALDDYFTRFDQAERQAAAPPAADPIP